VEPFFETENFKASQYLTFLLEKQWFINKLNRLILIAKDFTEND